MRVNNCSLVHLNVVPVLGGNLQYGKTAKAQVRNITAVYNFIYTYVIVVKSMILFSLPLQYSTAANIYIRVYNEYMYICMYTSYIYVYMYICIRTPAKAPSFRQLTISLPKVLQRRPVP